MSKTTPEPSALDRYDEGTPGIGATSSDIKQDYDTEHAARVSAEAAVFMRDRVLSIVSHDLRGPLNAIHSWAHVLERKLASEDPGIARAIAGIRTGVEQQVKLIEDVIDRTRSATRNLVLHQVFMPIQPLIDAEVANVRVTVAHVRNVAIASHLTLDGVSANLDAARFAQAIWALLAYSVETVTPGGTVELLGKIEGGRIEIAAVFAPAPANPGSGAVQAGAVQAGGAQKTGGIFTDTPINLDNGALPLALPTRVAIAHDGELSDEQLVDGRRRIALHLAGRQAS
ncbi:MAG: sensor histidine kinase [Janthinobacterium lividum]